MTSIRRTLRRHNRAAAFGARILGSPDQSAKVLRIRVQLLLTVLLITTHVIGAGLVVIITGFVVPTPAANKATVLSLAIGVPVYVGLAVLIGAVVFGALALRATAWIIEDRSPTEEERRKTLLIPRRLTAGQGLLWAGGWVVFTTLALVYQPDRTISTAITLAISGVVVCAIGYLFSEFALRPVAARALEGKAVRRLRGAGVGGRMVLFWLLGTAAPVIGLFLAGLLAIVQDDYTLTRLAVVVLVVAAVVLVFGLFVTVLNARAVVAPVMSVRRALQRVEEGDLDVTVPVYDGTELGLLQAGFNRMVEGLREREHLRDMFGRHVGREVAEAAAAAEVELGGESRVASVLFVDLAGSTGFTQRRTPTEVVAMLNRFFGVVVDEVDARGGFVNKFIGDAVLAIFGAPVERPGHAASALATARAIAVRLAEEVPEIGVGIGVATGEVVAGNVGHQERFEYTVVGDAVNSAARLTDLAKKVDGCVLAAWTSVEQAGEEEAAHWVRGEPVTLRGRSEPTVVATVRP
ncbi:adenylate cyclase [Nocardioides massiliensis]|uniref:Adenylate cyclase n=2 Tax=Nocardioides massiliensis TaxID=1325935 RepID=A0ABT9NL22_9ACTN|nr:adenylate/guanylate cyclase domain-containing protein [Nocardioides massiliensis]MDP9821113.1 adenylate cyclase [Nocardioides massiliensis]